MGLLEGHPLADGAEVVSEMERACGGLDSGEHTGSVSRHAHHSLRSREAVRNGPETERRSGTDRIQMGTDPSPAV
ncbi:hypothetical protein SHKM778_10860 [Streptomyces sp. KM77-8]|uniref:Uncharacterized protein n=1 Tax=Streptomyces haneummycinicus TaxID=3074435 RepID=A0AAT9HBL2_9ACTN